MAETVKKKMHVEYIAVGALVITALVIGVSRFKKGDVNDEVFSRKEFTQKWKEVEILEANVPTDEKPVSYLLSAEKEPFKGPLDLYVKEEDMEKIVLPPMTFQGMVWKSFRPQAVIDNKVYDIGDTVTAGTEQVKVKDITPEGIHLRYKGKEFIVRPK
ncbi:MAG: general secretion pathway protein GspB [Candidatus Omnitrophota bacterium]